MVMNWNLQNLTNSLTWFSGTNKSQPVAYKQMIAGYYDNGAGYWSAQSELQAAEGIPGVQGLMYTTWSVDYSQLENFAAGAKATWPEYVASLSGNNGSFSIHFQDPSGNYVPGGAYLSGPNGQTRLGGNNGTYSLRTLPAGTYQLDFYASGYSHYTNPNIVISPRKATNLTATLTPLKTFSIRLNAGGGSVTDSQGNVWSRDSNYSWGAAYSTTSNIANTSTPALYQDLRWNDGYFDYDFMIPNGKYKVTLKFAEIYSNGPRQRMFDILLQNQTVAKDLDVFAAAGGKNRAYDVTYTVTVTNRLLDIKLAKGSSGWPMISALEIDTAN